MTADPASRRTPPALLATGPADPASRRTPPALLATGPADAATSRTTVDLAAIDWTVLPARSGRLLSAGRPQPAGPFGADNRATG